MVNPEHRERRRRPRPWASLLAGASLGIGLVVSAGCSSSAMVNNHQHDPLHGVMVPPTPPQPTNTSKATSTTYDGSANDGRPGGVPALPASFGSSNNATLAGTSWQGPLGRPLAIDDNKSSGPPFAPGQANQVSRTQAISGFIPPNPNPKVEQVPDETPSNPFAAPGNTWKQPAEDPNVVKVARIAPPGNDVLFKQLQDRGVLQQKQEYVPEGIKLTCYISRGPTGGFRILDVTAADYPSAAQAILQQLDSGR